MATLPPAWWRPLEEAWSRLAQGSLFLLEGSSSPGVPASVQQKVLSEGDLSAWQDGDGRYWWTASAPEPNPVVRLAACAGTDGRWSDVLRGWAHLLAAAWTEQQASEGLTEELIQAWDRLKIVYRISQIVSQRSELADILQAVVGEMAELIEAKDVFLIVPDGAGPGRVLSASGKIPAELEQVMDLPLPRGRPTRLSDLPAAALDLLSGAGPVQDFLLVPLTTSRGPEGAIGWISASHRFSASDVQLMTTVADQVAMLMEGARVREAREQARRMDHELALAAEIQSSMLPADLPRLPQMELRAHIRSATRFGGDFYDVHSAPDRTLLILGDVAGKGVGAAMLTALVHATFHSLAGTAASPDTLLADMNRLLMPDLERSGAFVTCVVVALSPGSFDLEYASAGHVEPAHWRGEDGSVDFLPATGLPLGIDPQARYARRSARLAAGDVLLIYSDGVSEAQDERGKVLGVQGLADILYAVHAASADRQIQAILDAVLVFLGQRPLGDDVALLVLRALPPRSPGSVFPFILPADLSAIRQVGELIHAVDNVPGRPEGEAHAQAFSLALSEVVANQIRHAYEGRGGRIQGCVTVGEDRWTADIYDNGRPFIPPAKPWSQPDPLNPPTRGYGLRLIYGLVDRVEYRRVAGVRNHWHLEKVVGGGGS